LTERIIYVPAEKLIVNTVYVVKRLVRTMSKKDRTQPVVIAYLKFTDDVTGEHYLPPQYARDPARALTTADIEDYNKAIADGSLNLFVVNRGTLAGAQDVILLHSTDDKPLPAKYRIYNGTSICNSLFDIRYPLVLCSTIFCFSGHATELETTTDDQFEGESKFACENRTGKGRGPTPFHRRFILRL